MDPDANLIFGAVVDPSMGEEVSITLIATGVGPKGARPAAATTASAPAARAAAAASSPDFSNGNGQQQGAGAPGQQAAPQGGRAAGGAIGGPVGNARVRMDVPTGGVEIPAFLRKLRR